MRIKKPSDGANLITLTHSGDESFIVYQLDAELKEGENLVNAIGNYEGTTILDLEDEVNTKRLKIEADGRWTIKLAELTDARRLGSSANGRGDDVLLYEGRAGVATLTHRGDENFIVYFYNEEGGENLVNEIGKYSGESVISSGPGLVQITADGRWTIRIE